MNYCPNCKTADSDESKKCKFCGEQTETFGKAGFDKEPFYLVDYELSEERIKEKLHDYLVENAPSLPRDFVKEFRLEKTNKLMAEMRVYFSRFEVGYQYEEGMEKEQEVIDFIPGWRKIEDRFEKIQHPVKKIREKIVWYQEDREFSGHYLLNRASNPEFLLAGELEKLVDLKLLDSCGVDLHKRLGEVEDTDELFRSEVKNIIEAEIENYVKEEIKKELSTAILTRELVVDKPQFNTVSCLLFVPFYQLSLSWQGESYEVFIDGTGKAVKGKLPEDKIKTKKLRQLETKMKKSEKDKDISLKTAGQMVNRGVFTFFSGVFLLLINTLFFKGAFSLTSMKFSSLFLLFSMLVMAIGAAAYFYGNGLSKQTEENHSRIIADNRKKIDDLVDAEKAWFEKQLAKE